MSTVFGPSWYGRLNSATIMVHPGLKCLRLHKRIISRMIEGYDGHGVPETDTHAKKVDCGLNIYWTACFIR